MTFLGFRNLPRDGEPPIGTLDVQPSLNQPEETVRRCGFDFVFLEKITVR